MKRYMNKKALEQLVSAAFICGTAVGEELAPYGGNPLDMHDVEADIEEDGSVVFSIHGEKCAIGIMKLNGQFDICRVSEAGVCSAILSVSDRKFWYGVVDEDAKPRFFRSHANAHAFALKMLEKMPGTTFEIVACFKKTDASYMDGHVVTTVRTNPPGGE